MSHQHISRTKAPASKPQAKKLTSHQPPSPTHASDHPLLQLHAMIGNRAMSHLLQTKLQVNEPGDEYEREADRVADQVMRMPEPQLQRTCSCGNHAQGEGECEECRKKRKVRLQRVENSPASVNHAPSIVHEVLRSPGQPLDSATLAFMEPRLGFDFSRVRIHTDVKAAESTRAVNAKAYTVGQNVIFGSGLYAPASRAGRTLLAHELTHVIQQQGLASNQVQCRRSSTPLIETAARPSSPLSNETVAAYNRFLSQNNLNGALMTVVRAMEQRGEIDPAFMVTQAINSSHETDCRSTAAYILTSNVNGANTISCSCLASSTNIRLPNPRVRIHPDILRPITKLHSTLLHEFRHVRQDYEECNSPGLRRSGVCTDCNSPEEMDAYLAEVEAGYDRWAILHAWVRIYVNWDYLSSSQQQMFSTRRAAAQRKVEQFFPNVPWENNHEVRTYRQWCRSLGSPGTCTTTVQTNQPRRNVRSRLPIRQDFDDRLIRDIENL